jgi:hypothetical protein
MKLSDIKRMRQLQRSRNISALTFGTIPLYPETKPFIGDNFLPSLAETYKTDLPTYTHIAYSLDGVSISAKLKDTPENKIKAEAFSEKLKPYQCKNAVFLFPDALITKAGQITKSAAAFMKFFNALEADGWEVDSEKFRQHHFSRKTT